MEAMANSMEMINLIKSGGYMYADDWIIENFDGQHFKSLCDEHNRVFKTEIPRHIFQHHCKNVLGLRSSGRYYTQDQKDWLRSFYPEHGAKKTAKEFKRIFGKNISVEAVRGYCYRSLGVTVKKECRYKDHTAPIGTLNYIESIKEVRIKTENGWKRVANTLVDVPAGYVAIHLDRNWKNISPDNIAVIKNGYMAIMRNFDLWSENPEITRTSIKWCELYDLMKKEGYTWN